MQDFGTCDIGFCNEENLSFPSPTSTLVIACWKIKFFKDFANSLSKSEWVARTIIHFFCLAMKQN